MMADYFLCENNAYNTKLGWFLYKYTQSDQNVVQIHAKRNLVKASIKPPGH